MRRRSPLRAITKDGSGEVVQALDKTRLRQAATNVAKGPPAYHEGLDAINRPWGVENAKAAAAIRGAKTSPDDLSAKPCPEPLLQGGILRDPAAADLLRAEGPGTIAALRAVGERIRGAGLRAGDAAFRRGRIQNPLSGVPLADGTTVAVPAELLQHLAACNLPTERMVTLRSILTMPGMARAQTPQAAAEEAIPWNELPEGSRGRHLQRPYEWSAALGALAAEHPERFAIYCESMKALSAEAGRLAPIALAYDLRFQLKFALEQREIAWNWRNALEPGGTLKPKPQLNEPTEAFTNQMGIGMLEYLRPAGSEVLDCMRSFGREMRSAPFRRTEIREEHLQEPLPGMPLQDGAYLALAPELLQWLARQHHALWIFARELSWLVADRSYHQPPRRAHRPWADLPTATKNRDVLNALGVCFMLGGMSEPDYGELRAGVPPGNPMGFPLTIETCV